MKKFLMSLLIVFLMPVVSYFSWRYIFNERFFFPDLIGIPAGLIAALLFLLVNKYVIKIESKGREMLTQVVVMILLLIIINLIMARGGDLLF